MCQVSEIPKFKLQKYRNKSHRNMKNKNTNYRSTLIDNENIQKWEIQFKGLQKYKLNQSSPIIQTSPKIHI